MTVLTRILLCLGIISTLSACASVSEKSFGRDEPHQKCLASAGYTYSHLKKSCIRVFEEGIAVQLTTIGSATFATFAIFSQDGMQAEIFAPDGKREILTKQEDVWQGDDMTLSYTKGQWQLLRQ